MNSRLARALLLFASSFIVVYLASLVVTSCLSQPVPPNVPVVAGGGTAPEYFDAFGGLPTSAGGASNTGGASVSTVVEFPPCNDSAFGAKPFIRPLLQRKLHAPMRARAKASYSAAEDTSSVFWQPLLKQALDQVGNSCTGNSALGPHLMRPYSVATLPIPWRGVTNPESLETFALDIYQAATLIDPWPETCPPSDTGSNSQASLTVAVRFGVYSSFSEVTTFADVQRGLASGACVFESNWHEEMFSPERCGQIHVKGAVDGGHAYVLVGDDVDKKLLWGWTSWGDTFGVRMGTHGGYFSLSYGDFVTLYRDGGRVYCPSRP